MHSPGGEGGTGRTQSRWAWAGGAGGMEPVVLRSPPGRTASLCEAHGTLCSALNHRLIRPLPLAQPSRRLPPGAPTHEESGETLLSLLALSQVSVLQDQGDRVVLGKEEVTAPCVKRPFHPCVQVTESVGVSSGSMCRDTHPDRQTDTPTSGPAGDSHFLCWWLSRKGITGYLVTHVPPPPRRHHVCVGSSGGQPC